MICIKPPKEPQKCMQISPSFGGFISKFEKLLNDKENTMPKPVLVERMEEETQAIRALSNKIRETEEELKALIRELREHERELVRAASTKDIGDVIEIVYHGRVTHWRIVGYGTSAPIVAKILTDGKIGAVHKEISAYGEAYGINCDQWDATRKVWKALPSNKGQL